MLRRLTGLEVVDFFRSNEPFEWKPGPYKKGYGMVTSDARSCSELKTERGAIARAKNRDRA
jgi:hypothetical protein